MVKKKSQPLSSSTKTFWLIFGVLAVVVAGFIISSVYSSIMDFRDKENLTRVGKSFDDLTSELNNAKQGPKWEISKKCSKIGTGLQYGSAHCTAIISTSNPVQSVYEIKTNVDTVRTILHHTVNAESKGAFAYPDIEKVLNHVNQETALLGDGVKENFTLKNGNVSQCEAAYGVQQAQRDAVKLVDLNISINCSVETRKVYYDDEW